MSRSFHGSCFITIALQTMFSNGQASSPLMIDLVNQDELNSRVFGNCFMVSWGQEKEAGVNAEASCQCHR